MYHLSILLSKFKYRDRAKIVSDVLYTLKTAPKGKRITNIMQGAHLNFEQTNRYLDILLITGLVRADGQQYRITESGLRFAEEIERMNTVLKLAYLKPA